MKIMIEASVYSKYKDVVIAIDGDGTTIDTNFIGKEYDK